jgi:nitrogen fixation protein FixH
MQQHTRFYQSPTMMVGFILFLALVIGTIYRVNTAFETNPGLVNMDAYKTGQNYGKLQKIAENLAQQGYKLQLQKHNFVEVNKPFEYSATLTQHKKITPAESVRFYFYRPLEAQYDFEEDAIFDGTNWVVNTTLPRKGKWRVVVEAKFGENTLHIFDKLFVNNKL